MRSLFILLGTLIVMMVVYPASVFGFEHVNPPHNYNPGGYKGVKPSVQKLMSLFFGCPGLDPGDVNITCSNSKLETSHGAGLDCTSKLPVKSQAFFVNCPPGFALVEDYQIINCKFPGNWDNDVFTCDVVETTSTKATTKAPNVTTTTKPTTKAGNTTTTKAGNTTTTKAGITTTTAKPSNATTASATTLAGVTTTSAAATTTAGVTTAAAVTTVSGATTAAAATTVATTAAAVTTVAGVTTASAVTTTAAVTTTTAVTTAAAVTDTTTTISTSAATTATVVGSITIASFTVASFTTAPDPNGYALPFEGHIYKVHTSSDKWDDAQKKCHAESGYLTVINTPAELAHLVKIGNNGSFLVGLEHKLVPLSFVASDGSVKQDISTLWAPGQPDNGGGKERCVHYVIYKPYNFLGLNDYECDKSDTDQFICEKSHL